MAHKALLTKAKHHTATCSHMTAFRVLGNLFTFTIGTLTITPQSNDRQLQFSLQFPPENQWRSLQERLQVQGTEGDS